MPERYEFVRNSEQNSKRRGKRRKEWLIAVLVIIAVAILAVIGTLIWRRITVGNRFSDFCAAISESTDYAYRHRSATADVGEGPYKLDREAVYELYKCVCVYGLGREGHGEPDGEGATVEYGDGSYMRIVQTGEGNDRLLYFYFSGADGYSHCFYTEYVRLDYVVSRCLKEQTGI